MTSEERERIELRNHELHEMNTLTRLDLERAAALRYALTMNRADPTESWKGSSVGAGSWTNEQQEQLLIKYYQTLLRL
jgi:hypothetical protein